MKDYIVEKLTDEVTGWVRRLRIEKDGVTYHADLFWDMFDGFELMWLDDKRMLTNQPDWAEDLEWDELDERTCH